VYLCFYSHAILSTKLDKHNELMYGDCGLLLLRPVQLSSHHLFRFKLFLKRAMRKTDKTRRFVWFHAFPHVPLSKKPDGLRMGKGKGKLDCWFTAIPGGIILFEFKNLRYGRSRYFMKQMSHKLGANVKQVYTPRIYIDSFLKLPKKLLFRTFW
jgi:large subunit ribosomal protein L16